jgi:hypothetical protein
MLYVEHEQFQPGKVSIELHLSSPIHSTDPTVTNSKKQIEKPANCTNPGNGCSHKNTTIDQWTLVGNPTLQAQQRGALRQGQYSYRRSKGKKCRWEPAPSVTVPNPGAGSTLAYDVPSEGEGGCRGRQRETAPLCVAPHTCRPSEAGLLHRAMEVLPVAVAPRWERRREQQRATGWWRIWWGGGGEPRLQGREEEGGRHRDWWCGGAENRVFGILFNSTSTGNVGSVDGRLKNIGPFGPS